MSTVSSILNKCWAKPNLHILTFPYNGWFETSLAKTGHLFYGDTQSAKVPWNPEFLPVPKNFFLLNNQLPSHLDFDFILINDIYSQMLPAYNLSSRLHIPIVAVNHYHPSLFKREDLEKIKIDSGDKLSLIVSVSESIKKAWRDESVVIPYSIEPVQQVPKLEKVLIIGNFLQKDYHIIEEICDGIDNIQIIGNNTGLSTTTTLAEENKALANSKVYINLMGNGQTPIHMFRAMAAGCVVISSKTPVSEEIITDRVNGFFAESTSAFRSILKEVMGNQSLADKVSTAAKAKIMTDYSESAFITNWDSVFKFAAESVFKQ